MTFTQYILYVAHEIDRRLPFFNSSTLIDCAEAFSLSTAPLDQELAETSCISHHSTGSKLVIIIVIMTSDFMKTSKGIPFPPNHFSSETKAMRFMCLFFH